MMGCHGRQTVGYDLPGVPKKRVAEDVTRVAEDVDPYNGIKGAQTVGAIHGDACIHSPENPLRKINLTFLKKVLDKLKKT